MYRAVKFASAGMLLIAFVVWLSHSNGYLQLHPDLQQAVETLAKEGNWDYQYNVRAGDDTAPGAVIVVELGGAVDRAPCWRSRVGKSATERTKEMMNAES